MKIYQIFIFEQKQFLRHVLLFVENIPTLKFHLTWIWLRLISTFTITGLMDLPTNIISGPFGPFRFLGVKIGGGLAPF